MATTYKKNAQNVYKPPLYAQFWTWWALVLTLAVLSLVVGLVVSIKIVQVVLWSLVAILTIWRAYTLTGSVIKAGTIRQYITQKGAERAITKSLLATMSVNQLRDTPYISVPRVTVGASLPSCVKVKMEKLPGMYDIDKLTEDINASFRGKLSAYAVVSSRITDDGLYYKFVLEDKGSDKTWRPKSLEEMKQNSHEIKLQNDLIINLADKPHIIAWGKSGSGKSSLLFSMILQLLMSGSEVYFIDPKSEFSAFQEFYPMERIQEDTEAILKLLRHVCGELTRRQKIVAKAVKKQQKIGLRGYDIGLIPIVVVADEIGSAVASMDNKQKKEFLALLTQIVQKGRSVSVFCIVATQSPKTDTTLSSDIRSQFATKILLGSANAETQRMAFDGEVATKGGVERFKGFYISDGKTDETPLSFAVTDLHTHHLNDLKCFEKAYKMGSR
jgi:ABC-type cobalamin/Fe3+-siderophores transport system ATPase subunit